MRVFCREHSKSFLAPRQNPIKCGNRSHILGELDFEGQAKIPGEIRWLYCCNCEHLYAAGQHAIEHCLVCARKVSQVFLCDRCYSVTFESNTPAQTKNFSLTSEGMPQPSCPGCLRPASRDLREHSCDELGVSLFTALDSCPVCDERLDIGPSFPALVAYYLKRTKSGNKLYVTFDYETELFVPIEDGEFVLINDANQTGPPIVLPRTTHFTAKRQFYDFYEDHYHCANPDAGEVQIIEPVTVDPVAGGWKPRQPGILEIVAGRPKTKRPIEATPPAQISTPEAAPAVQAAVPTTAPSRTGNSQTPCNHCGSLVETRYAFCWHCGRPLGSINESAVKGAESPTPKLQSKAAGGDDEERTVTPPSRVGPILLSAFKEKSNWSPAEKTPKKKLMALALVGPLLILAGMFVTRYLLSNSSEAAPISAQAQLNAAPVAAGDAQTEAPIQPTALRTPVASPTVSSAEDNELMKLRGRAGSAPYPELLKAFSAAELRYPRDYRFSYERAKLTAKTDRSRKHEQAFALLAMAARKAIDSGRSGEMLDSLKSDMRHDLQRLSREHDEWRTLEQALKRNDKRMLEKTT